MRTQGPPTGTVFLVSLWLALSGCGTDGSPPGTDSALPQDERPSCETLEPRVLEAPLTGGAFHCFWCNREWKWAVPTEHQTLFVLISLTCERLGSEAFLEIRDAAGTVLWQQEVRQGDNTTYCIRHEDASGGILSVRLRGNRDLFLVTGLIEEFRGWVYVKVFNERGGPLAYADPRRNSSAPSCP